MNKTIIIVLICAVLESSSCMVAGVAVAGSFLSSQQSAEVDRENLRMKHEATRTLIESTKTAIAQINKEISASPSIYQSLEPKREDLVNKYNDLAEKFNDESACLGSDERYMHMYNDGT